MRLTNASFKTFLDLSNYRIDQIEEDLLSEKLKIKAISDDLDKTFDDMQNF